LANQYRDLDAMRDYIGVDSLEFLSIGGLYDAVGGIKRNNDVPQFTDHCFTGDYPTPLTDLSNAGKDGHKKLSLLKEAG